MRGDLTELWGQSTMEPNGNMLSDESDVLHLLELDRQWLAAELHDGLVQDITGAQMQLEALVYSGKIGSDEARVGVLKAVALLRKAVDEARRVILGLRPPALDEIGLIGAIKLLLNEDDGSGLKIRFRADIAFRRLDPRLETGIYRIVQEAVNNIRRHSKADRAEVRLAQIGNRIELVIRDSGVGFDPAGIRDKCFGVRGILERARLLGGSARVDSLPGKGTRIAVSLPLAGPPETT